MNAHFALSRRLFALLPLGMMLTIAVSSSAQAQAPYHLSQHHHHHHHHPQVLLGFYGHSHGHGVEVLRVDFGSYAQRLGLERGDVIIGVNGRHVHSMADYKRALARAGSRVWLEVVDVRTGNVVSTNSVRIGHPDPYDDDVQYLEPDPNGGF